MDIHNQTLDDASAQVYFEEWRGFFKLVGVPVGSLDGTKIPLKNLDQSNFKRLIITSGDMRYKSLAKICKANFDISFPYENMEGATKRREERFPNYRSAIWVKDSQESDKDNHRKSWRDLLKEEHIGINLRERVIFHLKYYLETGKHLDDKKTATLCSGTQFPENKVPYVYFDSTINTLVVKQCEKEFFGKDERDRDIRSRSVIEF